VRLRRTLAVAVLALAVGGAYWLHARSGIEFSVSSIRGELERFGALGPLVFVALLAARPFLGLPSWICLLVGGVLFGVVGGTVLGAVGGTLGGLIAFFVARVLGRDALTARLRGVVARVDQRISERGARWLAAYTAVPASVLTPVFFASGLSGMSVVPFTAAVALGLLPRCALYSYFGSIAVDPSGRELWIATAVVAATVAVVLLARRAVGAPRA
jgi:uncharacterized membrane protein YdjX (TVP38/TMEM64 family)